MTVAVDTSVAVPLLVRSHHDHADVVRLLDARFSSALVLSRSLARKLPDTLSRLGIAGGAVYDALVALAAKEHGAALATRDSRARGTYESVGVQVVVVT